MEIGMGIYWYNEYQIIEQNGKHGLVYDGQVIPPPRTPHNPELVLAPLYDSLQIINKDEPLTESEIRNLEQGADIVNCGELNCPIVIADGKQGLVHCSKLVTPLKYDQIIKLTLFHYLCKENLVWTLYRYNYIDDIHTVAVFQWADKLTLKNLLRILDRMNVYHPQAKHDFDALSRVLYKESGNVVSEYRRYEGWQWCNTYAHTFHVYTERVIVDNNFHTIHYDRKYPR
jgi:hypothetical protein